LPSNKGWVQKVFVETHVDIFVADKKLVRVGCNCVTANAPQRHASVAAVAVLIFRLCTLWLSSLIGFAFLFGWIILLSHRPQRTVLQAQ
jgi:hypothetical protein